MPESLSI